MVTPKGFYTSAPTMPSAFLPSVADKLQKYAPSTDETMPPIVLPPLPPGSGVLQRAATFGDTEARAALAAALEVYAEKVRNEE